MTTTPATFPTADGDLIRRATCPVCAGAHEPETVVDGLKYVRCTGCGLTFMDPMPTQRWYDELYAADYWEGREKEADREDETHRRLRKEHLRAVSYLRALRSIKDLPERGVLLEVGCGTGGAAASLAEALAWSAVGVEPDVASRRVASRLGVRTDAVTLDELIDQRREFDLVLLSHVLEHVVEPDAFLAQVLRVLAPQGMLIIEVPNGLTNASLHLFHPYLYTRRALTMLLAHRGLSAAVRAHGGASSRMRHHYLLAIARRADDAVVSGSVFGRSFGRAWSRAWKRSRVLRRIDGSLARRMVVADEGLLSGWSERLGTTHGP